MCRLVAYTGYDLLLANVLVKPIDSLVKQSLSAKESTTMTNGDGFGVGWYAPDISPDPALFLSILPAWNDENLLHLTNKIQSNLFFAHVRAASAGGVNSFNCHPFIYKNWMFMHNGGIENFLAIKRPLKALLDDDLYNWIRGETDSEHLFALFLQLAKNKDLTRLDTVAEVLNETFQMVDKLLHQFSKPKPGYAYYNICLTDGVRIVASRYSTDPTIPQESLHYLEGEYFWSRENYLSTKTLSNQHCVLIASEKLTDLNETWQTVPPSHFILVDNNYQLTLKPII